MALAAPPVAPGLWDEDAPEPDDRLCFPGDVDACVDDDGAVLLDEAEAANDGAEEVTATSDSVVVVGFGGDIVL
jgi:hypothetical protein